jgi:hypothetical protein
VDHLSGGIYLTPPVGPAIQVEAYVKAHENIRLHETFARFVPGDRSVLFAPWSVDNTSRARGLEVLVRQPVGPFSLTTGYTWSRVVIDRLGQPTQPAPWDRRHQVTSRLGMDLGPWSAALTGTYATGTPSDYAGLVEQEPPRIGDTARLDASLQYQRSTEALDLKLRAAVYNLTDRNNPWYRSPALYWTRPGGRRKRSTSNFGRLCTISPIVTIHGIGRPPSTGPARADAAVALSPSSRSWIPTISGCNRLSPSASLFDRSTL